VAAVVIAAGFITAIGWEGPSIYEGYPSEDLPNIGEAEIIFIGSSLTAHLVPGAAPASGVFGDHRLAAMLAVPGISEQMTTRLLAYAIESGAATVLVEINAYAHEYTRYSRSHPGLGEPAFTAQLARYFRELGASLTLNFKRLLVDTPHVPVTFYKDPVDGGNRTLNIKAVAAEHYYRLSCLQPAYPEELGRLLEEARSASIEVLFFAPPRPLSVVNLIGEAEFAKVIECISDVAQEFRVPVWYSPSGWPDDQFIDISAHANARGRARFLHELANWYGDRQ
jgi:hypothetical protein